jgi:hypothetical protein
MTGEANKSATSIISKIALDSRVEQLCSASLHNGLTKDALCNVI